MKVSPAFKQQIQSYLSNRAKTDILFGPTYDKENKNIDDCITYILSEVKKKADSDNAIAMTDEEVYSMAVHYYDEDSIVIGKSDIKSFTKVSHSKDLEDDEDIEDQVENKVFTKENLHRLLDDDDKGLFD